MVATSPRFIVVIRSANAPKSGGGCYRRPVHVRVLDGTVSEWHAVRGLNDGVRAQWTNVDSRYDGPRAEYGVAIRRARELAAQLNAKDAAALDYGAGI